MIGKFFGSIFNFDSTSKDAFQVSKHLSDYVGMFMRLAFLALVDRVMWAMFERGSFGATSGWFGISMTYIASGFLWIVFFAFVASIFNLTFRCIVEAFDEITGFNSKGHSLFWLSALLIRMLVGVTVGLYAVFIIMGVSVATQNLVKFLGPN